MKAQRSCGCFDVLTPKASTGGWMVSMTGARSCSLDLGSTWPGAETCHHPGSFTSQTGCLHCSFWEVAGAIWYGPGMEHSEGVQLQLGSCLECQKPLRVWTYILKTLTVLILLSKRFPSYLSSMRRKLSLSLPVKSSEEQWNPLYCVRSCRLPPNSVKELVERRNQLSPFWVGSSLSSSADWGHSGSVFTRIVVSRF